MRSVVYSRLPTLSTVSTKETFSINYKAKVQHNTEYTMQRSSVLICVDVFLSYYVYMVICMN